MKIDVLTFHPERGWSKSLSKIKQEPSLFLTFGDQVFANQTTPFEELANAFPDTPMAGCSGAGEIMGRTLSDDQLVVAAITFADSAARVVYEPIPSQEESFLVGVKLAEKISAPGLKGVLVLSDGLNVNGSELVNGLRSLLCDSIVITGGLAGDGDRFKHTWVLDGKYPVEKMACVIGFYGDKCEIGYGSKGGWDIFGPSRKVTKSVGNVLYEIDNQPALALYKKYLGERAKELPASALLFPLAVNRPGEDETLVRTILSIDEDKQTMTFAGDVPEGWQCQLMRANFDRLIEGASIASQSTQEGVLGSNGKADHLAIAISCVGRRLVLGERTEEEIDAVADALPKNTPLVGFYSYGEVSPSGIKDCDLHNQTMTLTVISERRA